jgi:curved DNA-binding protein
VPRKGRDYEAQLTVNLDAAYQGAETMIQTNGETIKVTIPPGVRDGQVLRVKGKGGKGTGGHESGHLYLTVNIEPDARYERKGDDLYTTSVIPLYTAILGGQAPIHTLKGTFNVTIPAGSQNGKTIRMKGMGMPVFGKKGEYGNLYVKTEVELPADLTPEETELFKKLSSLRKS